MKPSFSTKFQTVKRIRADESAAVRAKLDAEHAAEVAQVAACPAAVQDIRNELASARAAHEAATDSAAIYRYSRRIDALVVELAEVTK